MSTITEQTKTFRKLSTLRDSKTPDSQINEHNKNENTGGNNTIKTFRKLSTISPTKPKKSEKLNTNTLLNLDDDNNQLPEIRENLSKNNIVLIDFINIKILAIMITKIMNLISMETGLINLKKMNLSQERFLMIEMKIVHKIQYGIKNHQLKTEVI